MRRARAVDLAAIVALLADDPLGSKRERSSLPPDGRYLAAFADIDADPAQLLAVAEVDGCLVGCLQLRVIPGLTRLGTRRAMIEGVPVASGSRGSDVGTRMVEWSKAQAIARGCGLLQLTTDCTRGDAQRFYERLGFEPSHVGMKLELPAATEDR
jgi:GNAT superfamily N-acetyltransferase